MKKNLLPLVLALCLDLAACGNQNTASQNPDNSNSQTQILMIRTYQTRPKGLLRWGL